MILLCPAPPLKKPKKHKLLLFHLIEEEKKPAPPLAPPSNKTQFNVWPPVLKSIFKFQTLTPNIYGNFVIRGVVLSHATTLLPLLLFLMII